MIRFSGTMNLPVLCYTHSQTVQGFRNPAMNASDPIVVIQVYYSGSPVEDFDPSIFNV